MNDILHLDDSVANADWIKTTWDLPPYKSVEFLAIVPPEQLDAFRALPVYQHAVDNGLIHDDEWVADYVEVTDPAGLTNALMAALERAGGVHKRAVDDAAHAASTSPRNDLAVPSRAQAKAGNYKMGHLSIGGLDFTIENPAGSRRRPEWPIIAAHYGYVKRTQGADGDHIDVFIRPGTDSAYAGPVYVIDQFRQDGTFDEHKCLVGWSSQASAIKAYLKAYQAGWRVGPVTRLSWAQFVAWTRSADTKTPLSQTVIPL